MDSLKRKAEVEGSETAVDAKRKCRPAKTMALLLMYSGKGYFGMQRNAGFATIEEELLKALRVTDLISEEHLIQPGKIRFNRASKTDKNVSACGQVVSVRLPVQDNIVESLNENLPAQIRIIDCIRTTKGFHCKNLCQNRTYMYVTPTFAFAPHDYPPAKLEEFRLSKEAKERLDSVLQRFIGTRNYYNFTSGRSSSDKSCIRYMLNLTAGEPFERDGLEFIAITILGQSFMLHQIRKMVALSMAVVGNYVGEEIFDSVFKPVKLDIPKAPGLGLVLVSVNYDSYNLRYGKDGIHKPIDWSVYKDVIEDFQEKYIFSEIRETEKKEQTTLLWRETMSLHTFSEEGQVGEKRQTKALDEADTNEKLEEAKEAVEDAVQETENGESAMKTNEDGDHALRDDK